MNRPPLLVFGWGNRSRGDDALGPLFVERLQAWSKTVGFDTGVDFIEDYQLQPEHALDLCGRSHVLFVDASLTCAAPIELRALAPHRDHSFTSHALSPESVLQVFKDVDGGQLPVCSLLVIRGDSFELGSPPCESALRHLDLAVEWGRVWLRDRLAVIAPASGDDGSRTDRAIPDWRP